MTDSFDLTVRPWIPCERLDGTQIELSTRDVLVEAHTLRAIIDPSPLVIAVLHRHLLAVLHRTYSGPKNMMEWSEIAKTRRFDIERIEAYLDSVRDRMDLFHPTHPFAQTRGLAEQFPVDPVDQLDVERSSWGTARALFQHRPVGYRAAMAPAHATRALLSHHAFATGGLVKKPKEPVSATAAPLVRAAVVLLRDDSLFSTLISNLLCYEPALGLPVTGSETDAPAWEQPPPPSHLHLSKEPTRLPQGWLDMLTWLSRRIELVGSEEEVTGFVRAVGQGMADGVPRDPMVSYRLDRKRGFVSLGLSTERAFWRNANALFEAARGEDRRFERPKTIDHVAKPEVRAVVGDSTMYCIDLFGIAAQKSRVDLVRAERVHVVAHLFDDPDACEAVEHSIRFAEEAVRGLNKALWSYARHALSPGERKPDKKDVSAFVRSLGAEEAAWSELGVTFDDFLRALGNDIDGARRTFETRALQIIRERFRDATAGADATGRFLKARAMARKTLEIALSKLSTTEAIPDPGTTTSNQQETQP